MKKILKKSNAVAILLVIIFLGIAQNLKAASPGSLDPSFGIAGNVSFVNSSNPYDIAVQDDGKFIVTGSQFPGLTTPITARYTSEGILDSTFGNNGIVTQQNFSSNQGRSLSIQSDKKVVITVTDDFSPPNAGRCSIIRYNPSGTLDANFNNSTGIITLNNFFNCFDSLIQPDGKIVVVGRDLTRRLAVFRLNENGTPDTSFGTNGLATVSVLSTNESSLGHGIGIDRVNRLVVVGEHGSRGVIARFNTNGTLDNSFSGDGVILLVENFSTFFDVAVDYSGSNTVTAVGRSVSKLIFHRYNNSGELDTTFNGTGKFETLIGLETQATSISLQSDRKLIISGLVRQATFVFKRCLIRLNRNGTFDPEFGNNGVFITPDDASFVARAVISGNTLLVAYLTNDETIGISRHNLTVAPSQSGDFDGDGFGDIAIYRPSQGLWIRLNSSDNTVHFNSFGLNGDIPIDGDFDGDGRNDLAIYRPSNGLWFVEKSSDGTNFARQFGTSSDKPVTDDYDKDGKADLAFFRPSNGEWFILRSSDGFNSFFSFPFGQNGDIPIVKKGA